MIPDHDKIAKMIRLMASDHAGEVNAAIAGLRRVLASNKLTMHDLAAVIEKPNGKVSDIDKQNIASKAFADGYKMGLQKGYYQGKCNSPEFRNIDGAEAIFPDPNDYEFVARWCKERYNRLKRIRERQFIDDLIEKDYWKLSTKQRQWLQSIYVKLGGRI